MTSLSEVADVEEVDEAAAVEDALGRLIERGYQFVHPRDNDGELVTIVGVRVHGAVVDVVRLDAEDDVTALRAPADEVNILEPATVLWRRDGDMRDVVDALLELSDVFPEPDIPRHPSGRGCWVGNGRGRAKWLPATA